MLEEFNYLNRNIAFYPSSFRAQLTFCSQRAQQSDVNPDCLFPQIFLLFIRTRNSLRVSAISCSHFIWSNQTKQLENTWIFPPFFLLSSPFVYLICFGVTDSWSIWIKTTSPKFLFLWFFLWKLMNNIINFLFFAHCWLGVNNIV